MTIDTIPDGVVRTGRPMMAGDQRGQASDSESPSPLRIMWNTPPHRPLDLNGPVSLPYERFDPSWLDCPILDLYGRLAARHFERIAVDDGLLRFTCGELWALACRLGRTIAQSIPDLGPIAVLLPNGATYWAGVLGCFAAGRACILLDRDELPERNAEIIADAGAIAMISDAEGARRHSARISDVPLILIESALIGATPEKPSAILGPDDPAFILYTSGSVDRPKGIVHSQRNVLYRVMHFVDAVHLGENDRVVVAGAAASHGMVKKALPALLSGATLYPVDLRRANLTVLAKVVRDQRITVLQATPSLLRVLARLDGAREFLGSVRLVRTGAEPLLQADLERLRQCLPRECPILHAFGATEAGLAQWFVPRDDGRDPVRVAAGYPLPGCQTAVLDETGRRCGAGETGELVLRSRYVALGEWQNGRLVPGRMPPDPDEPSFRIYHTGDLVRQGADGVLLVVGRKDRQLKIRGQRVDPIEVEGVLRRSPDVLEAVVLPRQEGEDIRLVAFIVASAENNAKVVDSLRAMLERSLPAHMQPSSIILVDTMPLRPGGKIDAHALLARHATQSPPAPTTQAQNEGVPSARSQAMVAHAWRRTLDRISLAREQRFEEAGGDSLKLLQFLFHLERQCGAMLPLDAFSGSLSPSGFARVLDRIFAARTDPPSGIPLVFLLPGTSKRDPRLDRFRGTCASDLNIVPIDYGDWFEWVGRRFDFSGLVTRVVSQIETIAPAGPIVLAGYSVGGNVAHLAAQRLITGGRSVALLVIFGTDGQSLLHGPDPVEILTQAPGLRRIRELAIEGRRADARNAIVRTIVGRLIRPRWAPLLWLTARVRAFGWFGDYTFFSELANEHGLVTPDVSRMAQVKRRRQSADVCAHRAVPATKRRSPRTGRSGLERQVSEFDRL